MVQRTNQVEQIIDVHEEIVVTVDCWTVDQTITHLAHSVLQAPRQHGYNSANHVCKSPVLSTRNLSGHAEEVGPRGKSERS